MPRQSKSVYRGFALLILLVACDNALAVLKTWVGGNANWSASASWSPVNQPIAGDVLNLTQGAFTATYDGGVVPASYGTITISNGMTLVHNVNLGLNTSNSLFIGNSGSSGTYNISNGTFFAAGSVTVGSSGSGTLLLSGPLTTFTMNGNEIIGASGPGTFIQSGGLNGIFGNMVLGNPAGVVGNFQLIAGSIQTTGDETIGNGGFGTFTHTNGSNDISGVFTVASLSTSAATYSLANFGAFHVAGDGFIGRGGNGTFSQTGGSVTALASLSIGGGGGGSLGAGNGTYLLSDTTGPASLLISSELLVGNGGTGAFIQTGGTHVLGDEFASGVALFVGIAGGRGRFDITGGTFRLADNDFSGSSGFALATEGSIGTFNLGGTGSVSITGVELIGDGGNGTFTQSGSSFHILDGTMTVGQAIGGGTYLMQGGDLNATAINLRPNGTITQTGGRITADTTQNGGVYSLNGGGLAGSYTLVTGAFNAAATGANLSDFTQTGGTINGTFVNLGSYRYVVGTFAAQMINQGLVTIDGDINATAGIENDAQLTVNAGRTATAGGTGWLNLGKFTLAGGTVAGAAFINDFGGELDAFGTITAPLTNNGILQPIGLLTFTSVGTNSGVINANTASAIRFNGGLTNNPGGIITGSGLISGSVVNNGLVYANGTAALTVGSLISNNSTGELRVADGSTLNITAAFTNAGVISMKGDTAALSGGTISNNGLISGKGRISNRVLNNNVIRAEGGGILTLSNTGNTNSASGQIQASTGNTVFYNAGLATNSGNVALSGGAFDNNNVALSNVGSISGQGIVRTGALNNTGRIIMGSGSSSFMGGALTNSGSSRVTITGGGTTTFFSDVTNTGSTLFTVDLNSTAIFLGNVTGVSFIAGAGTKYYAGTALGGAAISAGSSVVQPGGLLNVDYIRENSLTLDGTASLTPDGSASHVSRLNVLNISTSGKFDLTDNDLIIDYTGPSPLAAIRSQLIRGFNGGAWNGNGITSSFATGIAKLLGYGESSALGLSSFDGMPLDSTNVLIKFTYGGDANLDGQVDVTDLGALATNWQTASGWTGGDFNYDGFVDVTDLGALATNWQQGVGSPLAPSRLDEALAAVGLAAVPEPSAMLLLTAGATLLVARRKPSRKQS